MKPEATMQNVLRGVMSIGTIVAIIGLAASAPAAIIVQSPVGSNSAFTVSSTDLLETELDSSTDSLTLNAGENAGAGGNTSSVLTNGVFGNGATPPLDLPGKVESVVIDSGTMTYTLDTSTNIKGYDITSIETYAGWADVNRGSQAYTVSYSQIGSASFTNLATVTLTADSFTQQKISIIEDASGILATAVDEIRFTFPTQQFSGVGYKELDVFGSPTTVPEPSSLALLGAGLAMLLARRRRRRMS